MPQTQTADFLAQITLSAGGDRRRHTCTLSDQTIEEAGEELITLAHSTTDEEIAFVGVGSATGAGFLLVETDMAITVKFNDTAGTNVGVLIPANSFLFSGITNTTHIYLTNSGTNSNYDATVLLTRHLFA